MKRNCKFKHTIFWKTKKSSVIEDDEGNAF